MPLHGSSDHPGLQLGAGISKGMNESNYSVIPNSWGESTMTQITKIYTVVVCRGLARGTPGFWIIVRPHDDVTATLIIFEDASAVVPDEKKLAEILIKNTETIISSGRLFGVKKFSKEDQDTAIFSAEFFIWN